VNKAVLKARGLGVKADYVVIGTILHYDSVLARLLDPRLSPGWRGRLYQAITRWAERQDLWDHWRMLYTDLHQSDEEREQSAQRFFEDHQEEMLQGTEVLWPEAESYLDLMKLRVDEGELSFDSEKQNQPIDPSTCDFQEQWFRYFDEVPVAGETQLVLESGLMIPLSHCDIFGATDPSMGKQDRHRDPSAIVTVAAYPGERAPDRGEYRLFFVLDASISRRHPRRILDDIAQLHRIRRYSRHGIETVQFQELFADMVEEALPNLHITRLTPVSDKRLRIQKLSLYISTGRMMFKRSLTSLYNQLRYFPHASHDDGPDALALCMEAMTQRGWRLISPLVSEDNEQIDGPVKNQLKDGFAGIVDFDESSHTLTCRTCAHLVRRPGRSAFCNVRLLSVEETEMACFTYDDDGREE
jgi:predicted phage terminase large subunit-like protein